MIGQFCAGAFGLVVCVVSTIEHPESSPAFTAMCFFWLLFAAVALDPHSGDSLDG